MTKETVTKIEKKITVELPEKVIKHLDINNDSKLAFTLKEGYCIVECIN